ncbi:MAG: hypothetical protein DMG81_05595 [Acidobacteria bacterium]|nr:MAG: hypothetical protein DMG81_05595 [Acidobacteriota bacterium]
MAGVPGGPPFGKSFVIRARLPPRRDALFAQRFAWLLMTYLTNMDFVYIEHKASRSSRLFLAFFAVKLLTAKLAKAARRV